MFHRLPLDKYCNGKLCGAVDELVDALFSNEGDDTQASVVTMKLQSTAGHDAPAVNILLHRPDPLFETSDHYAWRERHFGSQISELLRYLHERDLKPEKIFLYSATANGAIGPTAEAYLKTEDA